MTSTSPDRTGKLLLKTGAEFCKGVIMDNRGGPLGGGGWAGPVGSGRSGTLSDTLRHVAVVSACLGRACVGASRIVILDVLGDDRPFTRAPVVVTPP